MKRRLRRALWIAAGVVLVVLVVRAFQPVPVLVDTAVVARGRLRITADDDGRTRVRERYTISAPLHGQVLRTPLRAGDPVVRGETAVAEFVPLPPDLLDARSRAEALARLDRAKAALSQASARRERAAVDLRFAKSELARITDLHERGIESREGLDAAERDEHLAQHEARAAEFTEQVARYEIDVAQATLREPSPNDVGAAPQPPEARDEPGPLNGRLQLHSPIDGVVLHVFEESARTLAPGAPILEVGNTRALEVVADYLSQDAVAVAPGMPVLVEGFGGGRSGGPDVLRGRVRVVEPGGFTKISALGVEEQRVNIVVDPDGDAEAWAVLGDGYRVELRIVLSDDADVLIVPTGALFRAGDDWAVFAVEGGTAHQRRVAIGRQSGLEAQVLEGLAPGDRVVMYPSDLVADGMPVEARGAK